MRADVLVVDGRAPANCRRPRWIYDRAALKLAGSVFLYADRDTLRVRTVAQERGQRPWSEPPASKAANAIAIAHGTGGAQHRQGALERATSVSPSISTSSSCGTARCFRRARVAGRHPY